MSDGRAEHPADFRKDATIGGLGLVQLFGAAGLVLAGLVGELVLLMVGASVWKMLLLFLVIMGTALEITLDLHRRISREVAFVLRPRWLRADGSRPVTLGSEGSVQDLIRVRACSGPFIQFHDGLLAMILRVLPSPTHCLSEEQEEILTLRFQNALKRAAQAKVEVSIYADVEPDLNRPELERHQRQVEQWPEGGGVRNLLEARNAHHWRLSHEDGLRVGYHLRLGIAPADVPMLDSVKDADQRVEHAVMYLRDVGLDMAGELGGDGVRVQPLGPEGIRDLVARQLDPAGWLVAEPTRGTDWAWPVDARPVLAQGENRLKGVHNDDRAARLEVAVTRADSVPAPEPTPQFKLVEPSQGQAEPPASAPLPGIPAWPRGAMDDPYRAGGADGEPPALPQTTGLARLSPQGFPMGFHPRLSSLRKRSSGRR